MSKKYKIQGRIYDRDTKDPIKGVSIIYNGDKVTTNKQGEFKLKFEYISPHDSIDIQHKDYESTSKSLLDGNGNIREDFKYLVGLSNIGKIINKETNKIKNLTSQEASNLLKGYSLADPLSFLNKNINKFALDLWDNMLPLVIGLIASFGINKLKDLLQNKIASNYSCPPKDNILKILKKRNKLAKKLNQIYKIIDTMTKAAGIIAGLSIIFKALTSILFKLPIPSTIGVPPPTGGVVFSQTMGMINSQSDKITKLKALIDKFAGISLTVLASLLVLRTILKSIIDLLSVLDKLLQQCSQDSGIEIEEINKELLDSLKDEEKEIVGKVNGFTLETQLENKTTGSLQRKYAIAKDSQGVILLKGEPSFSADDKILIDELSFFIKTNNLKAT